VLITFEDGSSFCTLDQKRFQLLISTAELEMLVGAQRAVA